MTNAGFLFWQVRALSEGHHAELARIRAARLAAAQQQQQQQAKRQPGAGAAGAAAAAAGGPAAAAAPEPGTPPVPQAGLHMSGAPERTMHLLQCHAMRRGCTCLVASACTAFMQVILVLLVLQVAHREPCEVFVRTVW